MTEAPTASLPRPPDPAAAKKPPQRSALRQKTVFQPATAPHSSLEKFALPQGLNATNPAWDPGGPQGSQQTGQFTESSDGFAAAHQIAVNEEVKIYPFFKALWHKIDAVLVYPDNLAQQHIEGEVSLQLNINRQGLIKSPPKSVRSEDPFLETLALATVFLALKAPLAPNAWRQDSAEEVFPENFPVVFHFTFKTFGPGSRGDRSPPDHFKNILRFRRDTFVDPVLNQVLVHFFSRTLPPILPIPGGVYVDFPRAVAFVQGKLKPARDEKQLLRESITQQNNVWEDFLSEIQLEDDTPTTATSTTLPQPNDNLQGDSSLE